MSEHLKGKIVTNRRPRAVDTPSGYFEQAGQLSQAATVPVSIQASATDIDQYDAVTFEADSSENLVSFLWDFGDGVTSQEANPVHVFGGGQGSSYTVSVVVTDAQGRVGLATAENVITVQNDSYLFEKLRNPTLPFSLYVMHSSASKAVRIRESNNNTEMDLGFEGSNPLDGLDELAYDNFLSDNNASNAYVVAGYSQIDGSKVFEETDMSKQYSLIKSNLGFVVSVKNVGDPSASYHITTPVDVKNNGGELSIFGADAQYFYNEIPPNGYHTVFFNDTSANRGNCFRPAYNSILRFYRPIVVNAALEDAQDKVNLYYMKEGSGFGKLAKCNSGEAFVTQFHSNKGTYRRIYDLLINGSSRGTCFHSVIVQLGLVETQDRYRLTLSLNNLQNTSFY